MVESIKGLRAVASGTAPGAVAGRRTPAGPDRVLKHLPGFERGPGLAAAADKFPTGKFDPLRRFRSSRRVWRRCDTWTGVSLGRAAMREASSLFCSLPNKSPPKKPCAASPNTTLPAKISPDAAQSLHPGSGDLPDNSRPIGASAEPLTINRLTFEVACIKPSQSSAGAVYVI
jgi:hypothetical protein